MKQIGYVIINVQFNLFKTQQIVKIAIIYVYLVKEYN